MANWIEKTGDGARSGRVADMRVQRVRELEQIKVNLEQRVRELERCICDLEAENRVLTDQRIPEMGQRIRDLEAENRALRDQLNEALTAAARQAAPFRRHENAKVPDSEKKKPGRKPGHAGAYRAVPAHVDDSVDVPLSCCPQCGGSVGDVVALEQFIEEILPARPYVVRVVTYHGSCQNCGDVASKHPLQTSTAGGAAKVQLGPRACALAARLNKGHGLTMRTTCAILQDLAGLKLTPGGLAQNLARSAGRVETSYENLVQEIRGAPAVFVDETSWYVGEPGWWLWTFTTSDATVYWVDTSRGSAVVIDTLGQSYGGMLVSDCLSTYGPVDCRKHKCIAHHQQAIAKARKLPGTTDLSYLNEWDIFFQTVIGLWRARGTMDESEFETRRDGVEKWCDRLLAQERAQPADIGIRNRLSKQRPHLLGCLYEPAAEPTNNRAERALRPAVIARKLSCGNKTESGKNCFEVLKSVAVTCAQRSQDFVTFLESRVSLAGSPINLSRAPR
jgi:transposase